MTSGASSVAELAEVSLVSEDMSQQPFDYFAQLVENAPVLWSTRQKAWFVSRYDDVSHALRNDSFGSDRVGPYLASRIPEADRERFDRMFAILARWLVFLSPPDHTRLRGLVHKSFTPRRVKTLQAKAQEIATDLAAAVNAKLRAGETVDLMADYCMPLPGQMIAGMFGVPVEDGARLKHWAEELGLFVNGALRDPDRNERVAQAMSEFEVYLLELIEKYRREPADNILSGLVEANDQDGTLTELELLATCTLILDAGYKTIQTAMTNAIYLLMDSPEDWDRLAAEPALAMTAVEEFMRFMGPGNVIVRRADEDMEIGGEKISAGDRVYLLTGAANRDPRQFERPDELVLDRRDNQHLMFGQGIHFCLGASLARMELVAGLRTFVSTVERPELAVDPAELPWHRTLILHGMSALPVRRRGGAES